MVVMVSDSQYLQRQGGLSPPVHFAHLGFEKYFFMALGINQVILKKTG